MTVAATTNTTTPATSATGSSASSTSTTADLASGQNSLNTTYSSFLTLLTAQLQNQDPLSPMDTNTFTQQLVSMNGVQQQLLTNNLLQQLVSQSTGAGSVGSAVSLIGKSVTSQSSVQALQNGSATWTYNLASNAAKATLEIEDSSGNIVWTGTAPSLTSGANTFTWNGKTNSGQTLTSGNYTLNISATDASNTTVASTVDIQGTVTGVQTSNGTTQVDVGGVPVNFSTVTSVTNPS
jgi:flagellar basal-body rod modification protein FlgD